MLDSSFSLDVQFGVYDYRLGHAFGQVLRRIQVRDIPVHISRPIHMVQVRWIDILCDPWVYYIVSHVVFQEVDQLPWWLAEW